MSQPSADPPIVWITPAVEHAARLLWTMTARAGAKGYFEIDSFIAAGIDPPTALAAAGVIHANTFNPLIPLKAPCFFEDGDLPTLPADLRLRLVTAVAAVDPDRLPTLTPIKPFGEMRR